MELGYGSTYAIKGVGSSAFQLDSGTLISVEEILYVSGLKKNVLSVTVLEDKGFSVAFSEGKVLVWPKGGSMSSAIVIGVSEGDLYKVSGHVIKSLYPCQDLEIKREPTVLFNPQQSGVVEKVSRDVVFHHS